MDCAELEKHAGMAGEYTQIEIRIRPKNETKMELLRHPMERMHRWNLGF